ncbi:Vomp family autotransporter [Bartonella sp. MM73XJBT.G]|uniref:Vomp family autotransporter n=1 Tax=Bartonella sp. MM73XJBT.G TaxID=3019097 RepID=UPI00235E3E20|nr:Vomp family autotransporter [Bartonella sp. MM73XJBT.G]
MKKLYTTSATRELKCLRSPYSLPLVMEISLTAMVAFLSNVSLSFSADFDISKVFREGVESAFIVSPPNVISAYNTYNSGLDAFSISKDNYLTALNKARAEKVKASSDYANFLINTFSNTGDESFISVLKEDGDFARKNVPYILKIQQLTKDNNEKTDVGLFNVLSLEKSTKRMRPIAVANVFPVATRGNYDADHSYTVGYEVKKKGSNVVAIGPWADGGDTEAVAIGKFASVKGQGGVAIGSGEMKDGYITTTLADLYAVAVGRKAQGSGKYAVSIGSDTMGAGVGSVALGGQAKAMVDNATAIGFKAVVGYSGGVSLGASAIVAGNNSIALGASTAVSKEDSISIGYMAHASGKSSVAIGGEYSGKEGDHTTAKSDYSTAVGSVSKALGYGSTVLGHRAYASNNKGISIGFYSKAKGDGSITLGAEAEASNAYSIALGFSSKVTVDGGIAIGGNSVSDRAAGVLGYTSILQGPATTTESQWKSTQGAVSVGNPSKNITRQIIGVAAGSNPADAVNVRQLRDLEDVMRQNGWKLSVGGKNAKAVLMNSDVDFSTGSSNLNITKNKDDNKIKFDLARNVTVDKIQVENNILDATGLVIANGPKITTSGVNAGSKKITGVAKGTEDTDAVNFGQLQKVEKDVKEQVAASSFVKQDDKTKYITIGKETDGDKIDITNKNNGTRTLTGLKSASLSEVSNEAVTGSQLFTTNKNVTTLSDNFKTAATNMVKYFGGNAKYEDGKWTDPSFTIKTVNADGEEKEESYKNVAAALAGVGSSITNVKNDIKNEITSVKGDSLVKWDEETKHINIGGDKEEATINIADKGSNNRILSGVKDAEEANEAVNKGQLDKNVTKLSKDIEEVRSVAVFYDYDTEEDSDDAHALTRLARKKQTSVTFGKPSEGTVALRNVGSGKIATDSTEAINGFQLHTLGTEVATYFGGGASYAEGKWINPKFTVKKFNSEGGSVTEESYDNVAAAFTGVGDSITNVQKQLTEQVNNVINKVESESFVQQDKTTHLLTIGAKAEGTEINIANKDKGDRVLSGVKAATQNNEAVNKEQLDESLEKLSNNLQSDESAVVHYDKQKDGQIDYASVTLGGKDKASVAVHNVKDGAIDEQSHDAINGGQINKIFQSVVKVLGGGAKFISDIFTGPTYKLSKVSKEGHVEEGTFNDVEAAFTGLNENIKNVNDRIKQVSQGVAQDSLLWSTADKAFIAQHGEGKTNSKIKFLANGDISEDSTEAVNGSQLYSVSNALSTYLGGGVKYENGKWTAPNFKIKTIKSDGSEVEENAYESVAEAFEGISTSFMNIHNEVKNEINNVVSDNLVKQDEETKLIKIGGEKEGTGISIANSKNVARILSGVHAGAISEESTDSVNGSQLYMFSNALAAYFGGGAGYKDGKWHSAEFKVTQFNDDGSSVDKKSYNDVASAFDGVSKNMTSINKRIHDVEKNGSSNSLNWNEEKGAYDASHNGNSSKITNVADGKIEENSQDVVNGGQLWKTNEKVKEVENKVDTIDQHVKDIENTVTNDAVKYDKGTDGKKVNKVTLVGVSESDPVLLDNVADGRIESGSKEAVTGGQLYDYTDQQMNLVLSDAKRYTDERFNDVVNNTVNNVVNETKSYTDIKFEALRYEIKEIRKESKQAAAVSLAVSNLSYEDTPGSLSLSIGTGVWRNQSAFAIGAGYMSENGKIRSNISATSSGGHWGIGAGLRVKLN